jgi:hypothetical protein
VSAWTNGNDAAGERRRRPRLRRAANQPAVAHAAAGGDALAGLQAEVVLLREENARLKTAGDREPDLGALLDRARSLPRVGNAPEDRTDEAAQLLVEGMVMRESLLAVCRDVSQAMGLIEARLTTLGATMDDAMARS